MYKFIRKIIKLILNFITSYQYLSLKNRPIFSDKDSYEKNIILISHNSQKAGAPVLLEHIAKELNENGYNTVIITRRYGDMIYNFRSICYTSVCLSNARIKREIKKLQHLGYNNIICNTVVNGDLVEMLKKNGLKIVSLVHELPNAILELGVSERAISMVKYSNEIVFPSEFVYKKFCSITKKDFKHIVKTQGLYLNKDYKFNRIDSLRKIKDVFGYEINSKVILNVGTINKRKGFDIFIEMANKDPDNQYIWIGDTNCRYYNYCINNHSDGIPQNLLLPGYINNADLLACFYDISDVFVLTSREEPFGTIVLEAFNAYTPVVAFDGAGGYIDVVKNGETGILTKYESVDEMIKAVNYILENRDIMNRMKNKCKTISNEHSFSQYVNFLANLFKKDYSI